MRGYLNKVEILSPLTGDEKLQIAKALQELSLSLSVHMHILSDSYGWKRRKGQGWATSHPGHGHWKANALCTCRLLTHSPTRGKHEACLARKDSHAT